MSMRKQNGRFLLHSGRRKNMSVNTGRSEDLLAFYKKRHSFLFSLKEDTKLLPWSLFSYSKSVNQGMISWLLSAGFGGNWLWQAAFCEFPGSRRRTVVEEDKCSMVPTSESSGFWAGLLLHLLNKRELMGGSERQHLHLGICSSTCPISPLEILPSF